MKTKSTETNLAELTGNELSAIYGGTTKPNMIFVPIALSIKLSEYLYDRLKEIFNG
ncbi:MAG: hypothetical protein ISS19_05065 [Bacteroidales bacterium]|nr:hypothetical protein [Bacteroidales bacterium]